MTDFKESLEDLDKLYSDSLILNASTMWRIYQTERVAWAEVALTPFFECVFRYCVIGSRRDSIKYINRVDDELLEFSAADGVGAFSWVEDFWLPSYIRRREENKIQTFCDLILHGFKFTKNLDRVENIRVVPFADGRRKR